MTKLMTAYRFASLHNISIRHHGEWEEHPIFFGILDTDYPSLACLVYSFAHNISMISLAKHNSQVLKELNVWHEIGHFLDARQIGERKYFEAMPTLFREARASAKAIKLMKKYNRWGEHKRQILIDYYNTYLSNPCYTDEGEKDYAYLIKEA